MPEHAPPQPQSADSRPPHAIRHSELPLCCPLPSTPLWNAHPRVMLPIESQDGQATCPYCGTQFVLVG